MVGQKAGEGQWGGITSLPGSARTNLRTASGHVNRGFGLKFFMTNRSTGHGKFRHRELTS